MLCCEKSKDTGYLTHNMGYNNNDNSTNKQSFNQNARSKVRTCRAQSKSGNRLGYFLGSARASAAFSLICFKSVFQSSRTLCMCVCVCMCVDGGEVVRRRGEERGEERR
jgi:hypothetical protein